ncbi:hypothetical protein NUACC21_11140 [Scytonema sp. NUACC21]
MKRVFAVLRNLRPLRILTAFVASITLFLTQACSSADAGTPRQSVGEQSARPNSEIYVPKGDNQLSPYEGGMNNYSDVDPRTKGANVKAKAEALKENAEQNVIDETSNIGENTRRILDKKGENLEEIGGNLQRNAQDTADKARSSLTDFARGTKKGINNIQDNASNAGDDLGRNAKGAVRDATQNVTGRNTANDFAQRGQNTVENTGDFVQRNANQLVRGAQRKLEKAGDAIKDTID